MGALRTRLHDGDAGNFIGSLKQYRLALQEQPGFALAFLGLSGSDWSFEHESATIRNFHAAFDHVADLRREIRESRFNDYIESEKATAALMVGDNTGALHFAAVLEHAPTEVEGNGWQTIKSYALLAEHDVSGAAALIATIPKDDDDRESLPVELDASTYAPNAVALAQQEVDITLQSPTWRYEVMRHFLPWLALAKAHAGDFVGAETTLASTPLDCDFCLRMRGETASLSGDNAGAERWYDQAIARTPDLPQAYVGRGQARFRAGDLEGALSDARRAARISPHDCDPYGLWGDVLARRRHWRAARAKYEEALRYAPNWPAARRARDEVAARV